MTTSGVRVQCGFTVGCKAATRRNVRTFATRIVAVAPGGASPSPLKVRMQLSSRSWARDGRHPSPPWASGGRSRCGAAYAEQSAVWRFTQMVHVGSSNPLCPDSCTIAEWGCGSQLTYGVAIGAGFGASTVSTLASKQPKRGDKCKAAAGEGEESPLASIIRQKNEENAVVVYSKSWCP